jgi:ATP-dependent RNA helicase DeaD
VYESLVQYSDEFRVLSVYGGVSYDNQVHQMKRGIDIVVGTTGRVMDHLEKGTLSLRNLRCIVLDEADMMMDMGFQKDIEIVSFLN